MENPKGESGVARFERLVAARGLVVSVISFPVPTRSAQEAAAAIGCSVEQIAKTVIMRGCSSGRAIALVLSGSLRADERAVVAALGEPIAKASPDFVREQTGFAIGGVPPIFESQSAIFLIDQALSDEPVLWAAAGAANAVFRTSFSELVQTNRAQVLAFGVPTARPA